MRNRLLCVPAILLAVSVAGCGVTTTEFTPTTSSTTEATQDISAIRAQDDFYGYINAAYLTSLDTNETQGCGGSFNEINTIVNDRIEDIIKSIAEGDRSTYEPGSNEQLIYDLYYQMLDYSCGGEGMSEADIADLEETCQEILDASSIDSLLDIAGCLKVEYGVDPLFSSTVMQDLSSPSEGMIVLMPFNSPTGSSLEDIVLGGSEAQNTANAFSRVLLDLGMGQEEAEERGITDTLLVMEIGYQTDLELLKILNEDQDEALRSLVFVTNAELDEMCPNIGHEGIMKAMGLEGSSVEGMYILLGDQLTVVDSLLIEDNLESWKDILLLSLFDHLTELLPESYGGYSFQYTNDLLALSMVERYLPSQLGEEYVELYYDEETVSAVTDIAYSIRDEYVELISDCSWMSDEGKELVIQKLMNMTFYIGASEPHEVDLEDGSFVGATPYETFRNMNIKSHEDDVDLLAGNGGAAGFDFMAPQTVNACYISQGNSMVIPIGIMNAPFYDPDASYATNLGGIGVVIGHEISHAFDYHGMWYDANGSYVPEWMPLADREYFETLSSDISDYYSSYTVLTYHNVDGDLTIGENMADMSGLECTLRLVSSLDEKQEIFENFARCFASVQTRDAVLAQIANDSHSPESIRINATVALFDEFYEIYDVQEGDQMFVPSSDRVRRW